MKKYMIAISVLLVAGLTTVCAQLRSSESQIPSVINNSFQQHFPQARDVEWELENGMYKVEFETGWSGLDHEVWLDKNGELLIHKKEIAQNELPKAVLITLRKDYSEYRIDDAERISEKGAIYYRIDLDGKPGDLKLQINESGKVEQVYED